VSLSGNYCGKRDEPQRAGTNEGGQSSRLADMSSNTNPRRRPWEVEEEAVTSATEPLSKMTTAVESPGTELRRPSWTAINEGSRFTHPSIPSFMLPQSSLHRDAPPLHVETVQGSFLPGGVVSVPRPASPSKRRRVEQTTADGRSESSSGGLLSGSSSYRPWEEHQGHVCCPSSCSGKRCERIRYLSQQLMAEIVQHEVLVHGPSTAGAPDSEIMALVVTDLMELVVERLRQSNSSLRKLLDQSPLRLDMLNKDPTAAEQQTALNRIAATIDTLGVMKPPMSPSVHRSSVALEDPRSSEPVTPLEELQQRLSRQTKEFMAVQGEYQSSRQKLHRIELRYSTLEQKAEAADAEVITLTTEKERLEQTIVALENEIKELGISRNETRKSSLEMATQYLRILETAAKLHKDPPTESRGGSQGVSMTSEGGASSSAGSAIQSRILVLEQEIKWLQDRNLRLENCVTAAKQATQNVEWILKNVSDDTRL
jgi:hypothetical protein